jgi:hypothetical protein
MIFMLIAASTAYALDDAQEPNPAPFNYSDFKRTVLMEGQHIHEFLPALSLKQIDGGTDDKSAQKDAWCVVNRPRQYG